jgi:hypothetical protein
MDVPVMGETIGTPTDLPVRDETTDIPMDLPVMGETTGTPMSGDVHLFSDPYTFGTVRPILYGDCEGLDGGNNPAVGSLSKKLADIRKKLPQEASHNADDDWRVPHYRTRDLEFAPGEDRTQQWIVNNLYPTILFTYSDVVCFVTKNTR